MLIGNIDLPEREAIDEEWSLTEDHVLCRLYNEFGLNKGGHDSFLEIEPSMHRADFWLRVWYTIF